MKCKNKTKQNENGLIDIENKIVVAREEQKNRKGTKEQTSSYKISKPRGLIYSIRNMMNNIIITLYGERWVLDLSWGSFHRMQMSNHYVVHLKRT